MKKNVRIVFEGVQGKMKKRVTIRPCTTALEILKRCSLDHHLLSKADGTILGPHESTFLAIESGENLYAVTANEVALIGSMNYPLPQR